MVNYLCEFLGSFFLILIGDGVVANVSLNKSGFKGSGTVMITIAWGLAVMFPAVAFAQSGAHFNPAFTIAFAAFGLLPGGWAMVPGYIIAQFLGGILGACMVWLLFKDQFDATEDGATTRGCFCTSASSPNFVLNFLSEATCCFLLTFFVLATVSNTVFGGDAGVAKLVLFLLIVSIGMSFGGLTGYGMNPMRDMAPRIAYAFLPIKNKANPDFKYGIVTVFGPIVGALIACALIGFCKAQGIAF